jgi:hypothetical protein
MGDVLERSRGQARKLPSSFVRSTVTVSGSDWSRSLTCSNGTDVVSFDAGLPVSYGEFQVICAAARREAMPVVVAVVPAVTRDNSEYDEGMVARILRLDAGEPEAKFDNVIDMLDWLERD